MKHQDLFRQVAVDRLASPDDLHNLLQVTSAKGWIALAGAGLLLVAVIGWSVRGRLPTKLVAQQCILIKNGGVKVATAAAGGRLSDLTVEAGDMVTRGQIIGGLEQYELLQKIKAAEARMRELQAQHERAVTLAAQGAALRAVASAQQARNLTHQLDAAKQKSKLLKERADTEAALLDQGLISKQTLISTQLELTAAQLEAETAQSQLKQLEVSRLEARKQSENEVAQLKSQLEEARRNVDLMVRDARSTTAIVSPYTGKVLEVKVVEGQIVERGTQLVSVEAGGADVNEMQAYVYLPAADGKKAAPGMKVEISPSTVKREEFGYLPAYVSSVAAYPSTDQGLMRVFGNDRLVQQLSGTLAPIQIVASLKSSAANPSHYVWSIRTGPPYSLQSGTTCSASIVLDEQRPIALVIPALRKAMSWD
jgi:HlyD family secretion protein